MNERGTKQPNNSERSRSRHPQNFHGTLELLLFPLFLSSGPQPFPYILLCSALPTNCSSSSLCFPVDVVHKTATKQLKGAPLFPPLHCFSPPPCSLRERVTQTVRISQKNSLFFFSFLHSTSFQLNVYTRMHVYIYT